LGFVIRGFTGEVNKDVNGATGCQLAGHTVCLCVCVLVSVCLSGCICCCLCLQVFAYVAFFAACLWIKSIANEVVNLLQVTSLFTR